MAQMQQFIEALRAMGIKEEKGRYGFRVIRLEVVDGEEVTVSIGAGYGRGDVIMFHFFNGQYIDHGVD